MKVLLYPYSQIRTAALLQRSGIKEEDSDTQLPNQLATYPLQIT